MIKFNPRVSSITTPNLPNPRKLASESGKEVVERLDYNENLFGAYPDLTKNFDKINPCQYPVFKSPELVDLLAQRHAIYAEQIYVSSGSDGIIDAIPMIFASNSDDEVLVPDLTYERLYKTCQAQGVKVVRIPLLNYEIDLKVTLASITANTKVIYLVNPNMPTGTAKTAAEIETFLEQVPSNVLVVVDQAYVEYVDEQKYVIDEAKMLRRHSNLMFTRTFSKYFGMAAMRIGYLMASDTRIVEAFNKVCQSMPVSQYSVSAACVAVKQEKWYEQSVYNPTLDSKSDFMESLHRLTIPVVRSQANFVYIDTLSIGWNNEEVRKFLLKRNGISVRAVRDCGLRITIGTPKQMAQVSEGLKNYLAAHEIRR